MPFGIIKRWNSERGFGSITDDMNPRGQWTFVHISALPDRVAPNDGEAFEYHIAPGPDGRLCAVNLRPISAAFEEADRVFGADGQ